MLALFVNLFAPVCSFARIVANATCTPGFLMFTGASQRNQPHPTAPHPPAINPTPPPARASHLPHRPSPLMPPHPPYANHTLAHHAGQTAGETAGQTAGRNVGGSRMPASIESSTKPFVCLGGRRRAPALVDDFSKVRVLLWGRDRVHKGWRRPCVRRPCVVAPQGLGPVWCPHRGHPSSPVSPQGSHGLLSRATACSCVVSPQGLEEALCTEAL